MAERSIIIPAGATVAVAGMSWTKLGKDPRMELRATSRMLGSRHGLLIETASGRQLLGLVPVAAPSRARSSYSGAAWLANASKVRVLYIKSLPNAEYWVVCAGAGELDQRTDEIVGEEVAVQIIDMVLSDASHDEGASIRIAVDGERYPNSNMIERFARESCTFAELVRGYPPTTAERVRKLIGITTAQVLAIAAVVAIGLAGMFAYQLYEKHLRDAELAAQQAALLKQRLTETQIKTETDLRITKAVIQAVQEDSATPPPQVLVDNCIKAVRSIGNEVGGWRLTTVQCLPNGRAVDLSFQMDQGDNAMGTNGSLIDNAKQRFGQMPSIQMESGRASMELLLSAPASRDPLTPLQLPHYQDVLAQFATRFQLLSQSLSTVHVTMTTPQARAVTYLDPRLENSSDPKRFVPVPSDRTYRKGTMQLTGTNLWELEQFSLAYPFLTVKKIEATPSGADPDAYQWRIECEYIASRT